MGIWLDLCRLGYSVNCHPLILRAPESIALGGWSWSCMGACRAQRPEAARQAWPTTSQSWGKAPEIQYVWKAASKFRRKTGARRQRQRTDRRWTRRKSTGEVVRVEMQGKGKLNNDLPRPLNAEPACPVLP
uniref:Uncharacterized protein n=1 Tax=Molossus molossus TaxID=27622 RepID=A0A7J8IZM5_MOLMO|nr:hypothetical protein HJG59_010437 [Molossus molossus]